MLGCGYARVSNRRQLTVSSCKILWAVLYIPIGLALSSKVHTLFLDFMFCKVPPRLQEGLLEGVFIHDMFQMFLFLGLHIPY